MEDPRYLPHLLPTPVQGREESRCFVLQALLREAEGDKVSDIGMPWMSETSYSNQLSKMSSLSLPLFGEEGEGFQMPWGKGLHFVARGRLSALREWMTRK